MESKIKLRLILQNLKPIRFNGFPFIWGLIFCFSFSNSNAQNMFFHLLPGFVPAFTWVGLGGNANWNNATNWSTGVVPGPTNTAIFNDACLSNCDPTLNVPVNVAGLFMQTAYVGTMTQAPGQSITIGAAGWIQQNGIFVGTGANISMNGIFSLSGGTYTATSGLTTFSNNFTKSGGIYNANLGETTFNAAQTIVPDNVEFEVLNFVGMVGHNLSGGTMTANGLLTIDSVSACCSAEINNGTIQAKANVNLTNYAKSGSAVIALSGAGNQTITGGVNARLPGLQINSTGGTVTLTNSFSIFGNYTYTAGTVDASASTLVFSSPGLQSVTPGTVQYNNVSFASMGEQNLNGGTMTVLGTLTLSRPDACCDSGLNNGNIQAKGNVTLLNFGKNGTANIILSGIGNQSLAGAVDTSIPNVEINSTGGTVTVSGQIFPVGNWRYTAGTVSMTGSTLHFNQTSLITPGSITYENVTLNGNVTQNLNGGTMNVAGALVFASPSSCCGQNVDNGVINAAGNVSFTGFGKSGTAILNFTGTANTTLTIGATAATLSTTHNVTKTGAGKVSLVAATNYSAAGRNFTITSGTFDLAGFSFAVNSALTISTYGILLCNGGSATAGTWSISGQISCGTGQGITWTGSAGDNLWSTSGNWTNNTIPAATDVALFNNSVCIAGTCNAQIDSNLSVRGINLQSTYPGTLTQNLGRTLTIGTAGYTQAGGTFAGGNSTVTMNGPFALASGVYTATSATWTQSANFTVTGSPTFNHNNGSWSTSQSITITPNSITLFNMSFGGCSSEQNLNAGTINVASQLTLNDACGPSNRINNGTLNVQGDVIANNSGKVGSSIIVINGAGNQILNGNGSYIPGLTINKSTGILTVLNSTNISGNYTYLAGTVDIGTSTFNFPNGVTITPGSLDYNNVGFGGCGSQHSLNSGTMKVIGALSLYDSCGPSNQINSGTIEARGNIVYTNSGKQGSALLIINGTGNQSLVGAVSGAQAGHIQINKVSGILTISNTLEIRGNWTHTAGVVDAGTSSLIFSSSNVITPGSIQYSNVRFAGCGSQQNLNAGTMIVNGTLTINDACSPSNEINNGTIEAKGNLTYSNSGKSGTSNILINGTGNQTMTGTTGNPFVGNIQIDKSSGILSLVSNMSVRGTWTHTSGSVDSGTSTLIFNYSSTINVGTMEFANVIFGGACEATTNLNAGSMIVNGSTSFADSCSGSNNVNNGNIYSRGNVSVSSSGKVGSAMLYFSGSTSATLSWSGGSFLTNTLVVAKTGGASLLLGTNVSFSTVGRDFTISSGTLDLAGFDFAVNDILTVATGAILKCNGGEFSTGSLSNSGTVNCPGYSTYDFNWTGAGGDANWSTAGNWQGGVAPGAGDVVAFQDSTCGVNCNATISANASVRGVRLFSDYTGTISQSSGATLTVGARSWLQQNGTFTGSDANITVNLPATSGKFSVVGGTFTSTSAVLRVARVNHELGGLNQIAFEVGGTGAFNHNLGTLFMNCTETWHGNSRFGIDVPTNLTLYNLRFRADGGQGNGHYVASGDTVTVLNDFTIESGFFHTGGFIDVHGNLSDGHSGNATNRPRGVVRMIGTGAQTYGYSGTTRGVKLLVDKPSGSLTASTANVLLSTLTVINGTFTAPTGRLSIGVGGYNEHGSMTLMTLANPAQFVDSGGTLEFYGFDDWNGLYQYTYNFGGSLSISNAEFIGSGNSKNIIGGGSSLVVTGNTTHTSGILEGAITAQGNVVFNSSVRGSATFQFTGSGLQTISGSFPTAGDWTVNKAGGFLYLGNAMNLSGVGQDLTVTNGSVILNSFNLTVANNISNSGIINRGGGLGICGVVSQGGTYTGAAPICSP